MTAPAAWTRERPISPGWYFARVLESPRPSRREGMSASWYSISDDNEGRTQVVYVGGFAEDGTPLWSSKMPSSTFHGFLSNQRIEWSGPIAPPAETSA